MTWHNTRAPRSSIGQARISSKVGRSGTSKTRMKKFKSSILPRR